MASIDTIGGGNIEPRGLEEEMRSAYLDYALYVMNELGLQPNRKHVKCAQIVGEVMGKYHPHGDQAIYDTLARMAQDFSMRYPLVDGHGNFGNIDGWGAAAMRYTEARLDRLATEMLRDIDAETVDYAPTYDGSRQEPVVLPARFPNLLVNGGSGIAVGMATNIPPHNLREVISGVVAYLEDPSIDVDGLMKYIKGPDFPTSGTILGREGIRDAYATGRGRIRVQAKAHIEPIGQGKEAIIVTELPFQVRKGGDGGLIEKIANLVHDKKLTEITDIRDESDRHGMRIVIELKRDVIPKVVLNKLFKHTPMQTTFGVNMVALVDNVPRTLSLREVIGHYVDHQREVIVRRTKYELRRSEERAHVLEGQLIALANLDEVIALIRGSRNPEAAREGLVERFELTVVQAQAILQLTLSRLTALEADKIKQEHADLLERIKELREILGDESKVNALIKEELTEIAESYGDERRTEILHAEGEIDIEDLIADQQMVISITHSGYIKSLPLSTYRHEGRRLHRASLRVLHPRLSAVLHQPWQGLPAEGLRAAGGLTDRTRARAGQPASAARGRAGPVRALHARLQRGTLPRLRHPQGDDQEDRVRRLQHADQGRRHHRHQHPGGRRADRRAPDQRPRRHHDGLPLRAGVSLQRGPGAAHGP
jgi:DNA gyrase subunit A